MRISIKQMEAFEAVMITGTTISAAQAIHTTQPSISIAIKNLEDMTGLILFNRIRGKLQPTEDAFDLLRILKEQLIGLDRVSREVEDIHRRKSGQLRIACLPAFSQGFISRTIAKFLELKPEVNITVQPLLSSTLEDAINTRKIDIGIAAYEVNNIGATGDHFTDCNEVVVIKNSHKLYKNKVISINDLKMERMVRLIKNDPYRRRLDQLFYDNSISHKQLIEAETSSAVCSLVANDVGVSIVNPITALDFIKSGIIMKPLEVELPFITTLLVQNNPTKSDLINAFVDTLERQRDEDIKQIFNLLHK